MGFATVTPAHPTHRSIRATPGRRERSPTAARRGAGRRHPAGRTPLAARRPGPAGASERRILTPMARTKADGGSTPKKQGRLSQLRAVFAMTRRSDPAAVWWMVLAFVGTVVVAFVVGFLVDHPIYVTIIGVILGVLFAVAILARRAEGAAYAQLAGQPGAAGAALQGLRRGWSVEQQPVAVDPRSQDMVFRAVGRPGVVLVTEGPVPRVNRLADKERKLLNRVLPNVPVTIVNAGDGPEQVPLRKVSRTMTRMRPALTKAEVSEVAKRLRALGSAKLPIPKGVDPMRARPDRKATRGR